MSAFKQPNLTRLINILNEDNKQTVFSNEQQEPLSVQEKREFAESLKSFSRLGENVYSRPNLKEVVERITRVVETAKRMISESDGDVVDKVSESRHFKYVDSALTELQKSAQEVMIHERRMSAAYEDIAEALQKYYDVH